MYKVGAACKAGIDPYPDHNPHQVVAAYKAEIDRLEAFKLAALPALLQTARAVLRPLWQARALLIRRLPWRLPYRLP